MLKNILEKFCILTGLHELSAWQIKVEKSGGGNSYRHERHCEICGKTERLNSRFKNRNDH